MKNILVVDNDEAISNVVGILLTLFKYSVSFANSFETIRLETSHTLPDVLILDVNLDNEDGRDICKKLKSDPATKNICIILFSSSPEKLEDYKDYGADGKLEKPFNVETLLEMIEQFDNKKRFRL